MRPAAFHTAINIKYPRKRSLLIFSMVFIFLSGINRQCFAQVCVSFQSPLQAIAINTGVCTLSVEACEEIKSVTFHADYLLEDGISRKELEVATITRAPFKFLWDVTSLPNQLYKGMTVSAEALGEDDDISIIRRDGIFLTHKKEHRPSHEVKYSTREEITSVEPISLLSSLGQAKARAFVAWNTEELIVFVEVEDHLFYTDLPQEKYSKLGIEIHLDPLLTRSPYPSKHSLSYIVPLNSPPIKNVKNAKIIKDGGFEISVENIKVDFPITVSQENFSGYSILFCVPKEQFENSIPKTFGMNIIAKVLDNNTEVQKMSWVQDNARDIYCPFIWGEANLLEKPLFSNPLYLWLSSFFTGLLLGVIATLVFSAIHHKGNTLRKFELSEEDRKLYAALLEIVENNITKKNLVLEKVAKQTKISPRRINSLMKKNINEDFNSFVMKSRVEIAKERLRSSHSSETSIATLCGFRSVDEMEKQFKRHARTTPYRFREEYQVT